MCFATSLSAFMNGTCSVSSNITNIRYPQTHLSAGIGEASWAFKTSLDVTEQELSNSQVDLVFDGLDTFAKVYLVCGINQTIKSTVLKLARSEWHTNTRVRWSRMLQVMLSSQIHIETPKNRKSVYIS